MVEVTVQVEPSNAACANRDIYVGMSSGFECADRIVDTAHTKYAHLQLLVMVSGSNVYLGGATPREWCFQPWCSMNLLWAIKTPLRLCLYYFAITIVCLIMEGEIDQYPGKAARLRACSHGSLSDAADDFVAAVYGVWRCWSVCGDEQCLLSLNAYVWVQHFSVPILLRALNVTIEDVCGALLKGMLGVEWVIAVLCEN
ncbi:hypothetical protein Tco_0832682 [Tanacetum coccineum]